MNDSSDADVAIFDPAPVPEEQVQPAMRFNLSPRATRGTAPRLVVHSPVIRERSEHELQAERPQAGMVTCHREGGKYGNASVTPNCVKPTVVTVVDDAEQNIIHSVKNLLDNKWERVKITPENVSVFGILQLPLKFNMGARGEIAQHFPRRFNIDSPPRETIIQFTRNSINGHVDEVAIQKFRPNGTTSFPEVFDRLMGKYLFSSSFIRCVPHLTTHTSSYDLIAVFVSGFIMLDYVQSLERNGIVPARGHVIENAVTYLDLSDNHNEGAVPIAIAIEARDSKRIPIDRDCITQTDLSVLNAISAGPAYIRVPETENNFIHRTISIDPINWVVYGSAAITPPQLVVPYSSNIYYCLQRLAAVLDARDDYTRGFVRAQTILNGQLSGEDATQNNYFLGTLEIENHQLPFPRGKNIIWNMLCEKYHKTTPRALFEDEYNTLVSLMPEMVIKVGAVIACIITVAISTVFDHSNIGGRELNLWATQEHCKSTTFLQNMFSTVKDKDTIYLYAIMCHIVAQFTGMKLSWLNFNTECWCGYPKDRHSLPMTAGWAHQWRRFTPYICRPETLEWVKCNWLSVWGISGAHPGYNLKGVVVDKGLIFFAGDDKYAEIQKSRIKHIKNPYGALLINAIRGHFRVEKIWPISFRAIQDSLGDDVLVHPGYFTDKDFQPMFDNALLTIVPGTLLTFDWEFGRGLVPNILRFDIEPCIWNLLQHCLEEQHSYAGFYSTGDSGILGYDFEALYGCGDCSLVKMGP